MRVDGSQQAGTNDVPRLGVIGATGRFAGMAVPGLAFQATEPCKKCAHVLAHADLPQSGPTEMRKPVDNLPSGMVNIEHAAKVPLKRFCRPRAGDQKRGSRQTHIRTLRLADGPDAVRLRQIARQELTHILNGAF